MNAKSIFSGLAVLIVLSNGSAVRAGEWTSRQFTPQFVNKPYFETATVRYEGDAVVRPCAEEANLDVKWLIDLPQPGDGTLDHVNPNRHFATYVPGRDTAGCFVSRTLGDHQKDWDYIVAWCDRTLAGQGIAADAPVWDKVAALANAAAQTYRDRVDRTVKKDDVVVGEHPVEGIIKGTWCAGEASLMIAVASTLGLEGRNIAMANHTVCEIRIDGKWRFVENLDYAVPHCLSTKSFIEFLADPDCDPTMPDRVKEFWRKRQKEGFAYGLGVGRYWQFWQQGSVFQIHPSPENLHALYPSLERIPNIYISGRKSLNANCRPLENLPEDVAALKVGQDSGVRKRFHLGRVPASLASTLFLNTLQSQNLPSDGGDWVLQVNGDEYLLGELDGFRLESEKLTIPLPVGSLRANAENVVAIRCKSSGDEYFWPRLYYDFLMPAATFYYDPDVKK